MSSPRAWTHFLQRIRKRLGIEVHNRYLVYQHRRLQKRPIMDYDLCWILGSGRSGSTWLLDMLSLLPGVKELFEPYFGAVYYYHARYPSELLDRKESFFSNDYRHLWAPAMGKYFLDVLNKRLEGETRVRCYILKEINASYLGPFFADTFPRSRLLLLLRDPYDIFDSMLDMQRPGAWNVEFRDKYPYVSEEGRLYLTADHIRFLLTCALQGYESVIPELRLILRYEEILGDPVNSLQCCSTFLHLPASETQIRSAVDQCQFDTLQETGAGKFRRFGRAGIWKESGNFTPEVHAIANEILGPLRVRLGYE